MGSTSQHRRRMLLSVAGAATLALVLPAAAPSDSAVPTFAQPAASDDSPAARVDSPRSAGSRSGTAPDDSRTLVVLTPPPATPPPTPEASAEPEPEPEPEPTEPTPPSASSPAPEPAPTTPVTPPPPPAPAPPAPQRPPAPAPAPSPEPTPSPDPGGSREQQVVEHLYRSLDAARAQDGLSSLSRHPEVAAVAQAWSRHLADGGRRLAHNPSYADQVPPGWRSVGENVAWISEGGRGTPQQIADQMHQGWMDSPGHRANILDPGYTHVGIGVAYSQTHGYYLTQVFARY